MDIKEQHMFVCHSDGSTCEDGCDAQPIPGKMEELEAMAMFDQPPPGSWADVAREMARMFPDDGIDWDAWKDEMKETDGQGY